MTKINVSSFDPSGGASYEGYAARPDLDGIIKMARQTGRWNAHADVLEKRNKAREDRLEKEKEAAKEDLGNHPESVGFWSKLGDMAADGLETTLDVLSRFTYGMANTTKYLVDQDEDHGEQMNFVEKLTMNPWGFSGLDIAEDLNFGDIGGAAKAFGQGFSGKRKTTFADVIATSAGRDGVDNIFDNKVYQGVMGFIGDVAFDPTTYVGIGLVSKPLKAAQAAARGSNRVDDALVDDVLKLGMTKEGPGDTEIPLTRDEVFSLLGGIRYNHPIIPKGMSERKWRNSQVIKGKNNNARSKAFRSNMINQRINDLSRIRDHIDTLAKEGGDEFVVPTAAKKIDEMIDAARKEREKIIESASKDAYREGFKDFMTKGVWPLKPQRGKRVIDVDMDEVVSVSSLAKAFQSAAYAGGKTASPMEKARLREESDRLLSFIDRSERFSDEFKGGWRSMLTKALERDEEFVKIRDKVKGTSSHVRSHQTALKNNPGNAAIKSNYKRAVTARSQAYDDLYRRKAQVFWNLVAEENNLQAMLRNPKWAPQVNDLMARRQGILNTLFGSHSALKAVDDAGYRNSTVNPHAEKGSAELDESGNLIESGPSVGNTEESELFNELDEINDALSAFQERFMNENPQEAFWNDSLTGKRTIEQPGPNASTEEVELWEKNKAAYEEQVAADKYDQKIASERRRLRQDQNKTLIDSFTGGKNDGKLRIYDPRTFGTDGKHKFLTLGTGDGSNKALLELATDAERKAAAAHTRALTKKEKGELPEGVKTGETLSDEWHIGLPSGTKVKPGDSTDQAGKYLGNTSEVNDNYLARTVFERLFEEQTGYAAKEARAMLAVSKDRWIMWKDEAYSKEEFLGEIFDDPRAAARTGHGIPIPTHFLPFKELVGKKLTTYNDFKELLLKHNPTKETEENLLINIQRSWDRGFEAFFKTMPDEARSRASKQFEGRLNKRQNKEKHGLDDAEMPINLNTIPAKRRAELQEEAAREAAEEVRTKVENGVKLPLVVGPDAHRFGPLETKQLDEVDVDAIHQESIKSAQEQFARRASEASKEAKATPGSKQAEVEEKIKRLADERDDVIRAANAARDEARKVADSVKVRIDEQILLNILEEANLKRSNYLRISVGGLKLLDIPQFNSMTKATEKLGGLPILQAANKVWAESFRPASALEPEMNAARLRATSRTNDLIKMHLDDLMGKFSKFAPTDRRAAFDAVVKGAPVGDRTLFKETEDFFENFAKVTENTKGIWDNVEGEYQAITVGDLNRFLPEEFKFYNPDPTRSAASMVFTDGNHVMSLLRNLKPNTDPMKVMWQLTVAREKALAHAALRVNMRNLFGVKRFVRDPEMPDKKPTTKDDIVEELRAKHNWRTVKDIGETHYFPPDVADEMDTLMKMMKPREQDEMMRVYDKALRAWKSAVTVYNPGYYSRNGIGEVMMGWFDGLTDPRWYHKAGKVIKYGNPDEVQEVLKGLQPWKKHQSKRREGKNIAFHHYGKKVTYEDINVLYHEVGLKSGFVSTEFDHYFPTANTLRSTGVGQVMRGANDFVRDKGEKFEDYFRLAHFMYRIQKSGQRDLYAAAKESAEYVRKYHFDYTDFTQFEKSTMMRLFPFYKWTRKAVPLMGSMLFTQPGKVMLYPKGMTGLSYATGGSDPLSDDNGFVPNYEDVTPDWIQKMFAYPIGRDEEGAMDYMNIATPQMDVFKMMQSPGSTIASMLTPYAKVPIEQYMGHGMDPDFNFKFEDQKNVYGEKDESEARWDHAFRQTPQTSFLNKIADNRDTRQGGERDSALTEPGWSPLDEAATSFITGLGFYENNKDRQAGEKMRRAMEK